MANPQIIEYIRQAKASGLQKSDIAKALVANGWLITDVNEAFAVVEGVLASVPSVPRASVGSPAPVVQTASGHRPLLVVLVAMLLVVLLSGTVYAYIQKIGPFSNSPYNEKNLLSGLLGKVAGIQTATYVASASLVVEPRDADAKPFVIVTSNQDALKTQYENDAKRARAVTSILDEFSLVRQPYPNLLETVIPQVNHDSPSYGSKTYFYDPVTMKPYSYAITNGGKNFALTVTFETPDAIRSIKNGYQYSATTTLIQDKTVTFTKDSSSYLYFSATPPKPFFVQLQDWASYLPAELSASFSLGATTDFSNKQGSDWKFNVDATGDFGDLTYKINLEALQKSGIYYVRVNNIPSIFGSLATYKGTWIQIDPKAATSTSSSYDELSYMASQLPEAEASYKQNRNQAGELLTKAVAIADEEGLVTFKKPPYAERIEGRLLYRYDLQFKKEAILPFYKRLLAEADKLATTSAGRLFDDQGMVEYLQSKEFSDVFDYYQNNTMLTLWTDSDGSPAIAEYTLRFVPPNTALMLKDKQAKLTFKVVFSNINEPVTIEAPTGAKLIQEILGPILGTAKVKATDAKTQANLSALRVSAELYYSKHSTYGPSGKTIDACVDAGAATLFKDVESGALSIVKDLPSTKGCNVSGNGKSYAAWATLGEEGKGYWCVDSDGISKQESTRPPAGSTKCP